MKTMRYSMAATLVLTAQFAHGFEAASQTVEFGIYVPPIVRWLDNVGSGADGQATLSFPYDSEHPERNQDSETFRLILNVDVVLQARVTPYTNINDRNDTLITEWQIQDDRDGDPEKTGMLPGDADPLQGCGAYVTGDRFLRNGVRLTHQPGDGAVKLEVTAKGSRRVEPTNDPADDVEPVTYAATVVLTALPQTATFNPTLTGTNYGVLR